MFPKRIVLYSFALLAGLILLSRVALQTGLSVAPSLASAGAPIFVDSGQALGDTQSSAVAMGDVDGDGDLDAYVAGAIVDILWRNNGDGSFTADDQTLSNAFGLSGVLGDLDGDGDLDLFLGVSGPNEVWLNDGGSQGGSEGRFIDSGQQLGSAGSNGVALADVDGDGDLDAVVANGDATSPANRLWLNDGNGNFSDSGELLGAGWTNAVAVGDVDGQNGLDIYFARTGFDELWFNDGNGHFTPDDTQQFSGDTGTDVALGDVDGDGDLDAWVATAPVASQVWLNDGLGGLSDSGQGLGANRAVALADLDGDLDLDAVAVRDISPRSFDVWVNDGQGVFSYEQSGGGNFDGLALGNLDGQSGPDLFLIANGADEVWFNRETFAPQVDVSVSAPPTEYIHGISGFPYSTWEEDFTITVHNAGPATATDVVVHAQQGSFELGYDILVPTYNFGALAPGQSISRTLFDVPTLPYGGQLETIHAVARANVSVTANEVDLDVENNQAQGEVVFYGCPGDSGITSSCWLSNFFCEEIPPGQASVIGNQKGIPSLLHTPEEAVIDLIVYYYVRDSILAGTAAGQHYIDLYYTHDPEIQDLMGANLALKDQGIATLQLWEPNLWALVLGRGHTAVITAEQVDAVDSFLSNLSAVASPALQQAIAEERAALPPLETFVGMTLAEARGNVVGYGVFLPMITK
jgi:hypothetical protein